MDLDRTLRESYSVAGRVWELATNSPHLLDAARKAFPAGVVTCNGEPDLSLAISVSAHNDAGSWPAPKCRGRDHLVFCQLSDCSAIVFDTSSRQVIGEVTPAVAADPALWCNIVFPFALGVMSPVLESVPLHSGCFVHNGRGVLVGARSGAGKSTLMATLARRGVTYISDDWVYLVSRPDLRVYALPVPLKLLPDAPAFFPELRGLKPTPAENGEVSLSLDPTRVFGAPRAFDCVPETVILFDRVEGTELRVRHATEKDLTNWFCESLDCVPECLNGQRECQLTLIRSLQRCSCFVVTASGDPEMIADVVLSVVHGNVVAEPPCSGLDASGIRHLDLLRRGVTTPHSTTVAIGDNTAEFATDNTTAFGDFQRVDAVTDPWRMQVITEHDAWPSSRDFSWTREHLGFVAFAQGGAMAYDNASRNAAAFVTSSAIESGRFARRLETIVGTSSFAAAGGVR